MPQDPANLTEIQMVCHFGTHLDAPLHFITEAPAMDEVPLTRLYGPGGGARGRSRRRHAHHRRASRCGHSRRGTRRHRDRRQRLVSACQHRALSHPSLAQPRRGRMAGRQAGQDARGRHADTRSAIDLAARWLLPGRCTTRCSAGASWSPSWCARHPSCAAAGSRSWCWRSMSPAPTVRRHASLPGRRAEPESTNLRR